MIEFSQKFDGAINIITALALIYYAVFMNVVEKNGGLRKRLLFLLGTLATLCLSRGINYILNLGPSVEIFILIVSSIIPLALFLLIELLIRRHLPLPLKLFSGLSTVFLIFAFLIFGIDKYALMALMSTYVITMISIFTVILTNKNLNLLPSEESLLKINMVIMILICPLIVTDFKKVFGWDTIRFGAFGILFFLYALVKIWENIDIKGGFSRLIYLLCFNIFSAFVLCWLFNIYQYYFHVFIIFIMLRMFSDILIYSRDSYSKKAKDMAYKVIDAFTSGNFKIDSIKKELSNDTFFILTKNDLAHYRSERILQAFEQKGLHFKGQLYKLKINNDTRDELLHIYEDFDCNACIFSKTIGDDFIMILFKWPNMAPKSKLDKEINLIQALALKIKD